MLDQAIHILSELIKQNAVIGTGASGILDTFRPAQSRYRESGCGIPAKRDLRSIPTDE